MSRILIASLIVLFFGACAATTEPEPPPPPVVRQAPPPPPPPPPPPEPAPEPAPLYEAVELPKTASSRPALALGGLAALAGAGVLGWLRRRV